MRTCYGHIGNTNGEPSSYSAESKSGRLSQQIEARQSSTQTAIPTQANGLLNDIDEYWDITLLAESLRSFLDKSGIRRVLRYDSGGGKLIILFSN